MRDPDLPEDEHEMELVMPFVLVRNHGGPFDDEAFAAGWMSGMIDATLRHIPEEVWVIHFPIVRRELSPQLELIGMRHGFPVVVITPTDVDWNHVTFRRGEKVPE